MTQITSIKVGLIAICIATLSLSLAQKRLEPEPAEAIKPLAPSAQPRATALERQLYQRRPTKFPE